MNFICGIKLIFKVILLEMMMFCRSIIHCSRDFDNEDGHMLALLLYLTANVCGAHVNNREISFLPAAHENSKQDRNKLSA